MPGPQEDYGLLLFAFHPDLLRDDGGYESALDGYVAALEAVPALDGAESPRLPGARSLAARDRRLAEGIEIEDALWKDLLAGPVSGRTGQA